jgi:Barstar (barnase inhibitor)
MTVPLLSPLLKAAPDLKVFLWGSDASTAADIATSWTTAGITVRTVRGRKMRGYQGLFDEFAAAWQFPWYFGENSSAFDECLADLSWLPAPAGYALVFRCPAEVLADTDDGLTWLVGSLTRAAAAWATPIEMGEWWDRPAIPFHVILQSPAIELAEVRDRWASAGADVIAFPTGAE